MATTQQRKSSTAADVVDGANRIADTITEVSAEAGERWTGGALGELIESGAEFTVTFWARIHEENPSGDSTYLIQLGEAHTYGGPLE